MQNKYYTPEIEEFYVGFEYELCDDHDYNDSSLEKYWSKEIWNSNNSVLDEYKEYRVKYLDNEDVISLGYTLNSNSNRFNKGNITITGGGILNENYKFIIIKENNVIFEGTIKNKSELVKLLKQLGV